MWLQNYEISFLRQYRTPTSEGYLIRNGKEPLSHVDIHLSGSATYVTLVLFRELEEEQLLDLLCSLEENLISSVQSTDEELYVSVFRGAQEGFYTEQHLEEYRSRQSN